MDEILVANFMVFHDVVRDEQLRPVDRRRGVGARLLPAREPGAEDGRVRVADRLRRLAADARRRRARGVPDRRLQRRDDRADRALPARARPGDLRRRPRRHRPRQRSAPACPRSATGPSSTSASPATSPASTPRTLADREALRAELGYRARRAASASSRSAARASAPTSCAGSIASFPAGQAARPGLRMIVVAGPADRPGVAAGAATASRSAPTCHDLYRHLAACDLAIVQGGLTTAMELTANRRPFLYFPLKHHFEQNFHVRHRLERYGAGRRMDFDDAPPGGDRRGDRGGDRPRRSTTAPSSPTAPRGRRR